MGSTEDSLLSLERGTYYLVLFRDSDEKGRPKCIRCGGKGRDVHEIIPRSSFGKGNMAKCFSKENRCCLCRKCHGEVVSDYERGRLLDILSRVYGYEYNSGIEEWLLKSYLAGGGL